MAPYIGKNLVVTFGGVTINTVYRTLKNSASVDTVDKSAGAEANKTYLGALKDNGWSADVLIDGTAVIAACYPNTEGTLVISPEGTTAGKPKTTVTALVSKFDRNYAYNDLATASVEWKPTGIPTEGTN